MKLKKEYIDEKTKIAYTLKGNYYFPNLSITKVSDRRKGV